MPEIEEMCTIAPPPASSIQGATLRVARTAAITSTPKPAAERLAGAVQEALERRLVGDVAGGRVDLAAEGAQLARGALQTLRPARAEGQAGALPREGERDGAPDAPARAGHDHSPARQPEVHGFLLRSERGKVHDRPLPCHAAYFSSSSRIE
jgi:hypothetical protein